MTPAELIQYINEHLPSNNRIRMDVLRDVLHQLAQAATGGIIEIISQEVQGEVKARIEFNGDHFLIETLQGGGIKINLKNPGGGEGIPDAPLGDIIYARENGKWVNITSLFNQKENTSNKRKTFNLPDHTTYPTTQGVVDYLEAILEGYVDKTTYDPTGVEGDAFDYENLHGKPTKTSDFINDGETGDGRYVEEKELAEVAYSGSYNDLKDAPEFLEWGETQW